MIVAELGLPEIRLHDLRHSYAVASLESGDDIKTVQENLGHATASFTLDVYGHLTKKMTKCFSSTHTATNKQSQLKAIKGNIKGRKTRKPSKPNDFKGLHWRRRRDSNPRNPFGVYTISSRAPSTRLGDFSICRYSAQMPDNCTFIVPLCQ